jgi:hypothetical protein
LIPSAGTEIPTMTKPIALTKLAIAFGRRILGGAYFGDFLITTEICHRINAVSILLAIVYVVD